MTTTEAIVGADSWRWTSADLMSLALAHRCGLMNCAGPTRSQPSTRSMRRFNRPRLSGFRWTERASCISLKNLHGDPKTCAGFS